ncbi:hypothetical protein V5O48_006299 [Marasmius crinis-equi]|uniref:Ubiquitin-like domain-containing protein n=1 Tax=Marasmius crinis-equi TaxID=585013 RepID=A0ABR3FJW8_9AGAR
MSVLPLSRDEENEPPGTPVVATYYGTKRKLLRKEATYESFARTVKDSFSISKDSEIIMETKDYDICDDRLFEIDADAFPFLVPTLRAVHVTTAKEESIWGENENENDTQETRIKPCMGLPRRVAQYAEVSAEEQTESPHPAAENPAQNASAEDPDGPIFIRVIGPKTKTWVKLGRTTSMAAVLEKTRKIFEEEKITGLEILTEDDGECVHCDMNSTAGDLGISDGDIIKLVLIKEAGQDT